MKEKIIELVTIVSKLVSWVFGCLVIYWLILKITGHSPTSDQIMLILQGTTLTLLIKHMLDFKSHKTKADIHIKECDRRFYALAKDFKNTDSEFRKHMMKYHKAKYCT